MKSSGSLLRRSAGKLFFFSLLLIGGILSLPVSPVQAQKAGAPQQRIVQGRVVDKNNAAIHGAVVYLKDGHTLSVRSFISDNNGGFRFGQLGQNTDYEIWAESDSHKSGTKSISSFDSKSEYNFILKIDTAK
jgi:Carboxypeptidase regulatory-like domain